MTTDELRAIAEAATKGPWEYDGVEYVISAAMAEVVAWPFTNADAAHIATFHPARILAMLDVIEAARNRFLFEHDPLYRALVRLKEMER